MERFQLLKSELFDLLFNGQAVNRQDLLTTLLNYVQDHYMAIDVTLFSHTSEDFIIVSSTSQEIMNNPNYFTNLFSSQTELLEEGKVKIITTDIHHLVLIPLRLKNNKLELILMTLLADHEVTKGMNWDEISKIFSTFLNKVYEFVNLTDEYRRYEQLYRVTSKFHSSMNMDDILKEVIETLREVYPDFTYYLLLSHDYNHLNDLPIKEIQYDETNMAVTQAFVTGEVQLEDRVSDRTSLLYAPLKGRQGVYGVLQMIAPNTLFFPKEEISFITLLANTAGSAIENAKLYQQSNRLIADLQLINETSHQLNSNLRLTEAMGYMSNQIIKSFQADEVGFILFKENSDYQILPGSTDFFLKDASTVITKVQSKLMVERESIFVGDLTLDSETNQVNYRSLMAVPMIQGADLRGVSIVLQKEPYAFPFETFKLLQSLIHHSTLALSNSLLREELEKLVITDHLTKLSSRSYLNDQISKSMENDAFGTFLLIDIDDFKLVNDTFGHQVGDDVLKQVADIIRDNIREFDVGARWGGEELAVYLPRVDLQSGVAIAERLVQKVSESTNPKVTISCGVGHWEKGHSDTPITLFKRADEALYSAKGTGKNRVRVQEKLYN
ncbi:diguanylate cyclase domain-containing protein [Bacillus pinisoli]|uniref:sensor domain-containing diguanylate cyclase n=1 Tax=Bacillus pinisoli TaxID=2901866 RepID=UPI001FF372E2|nr:diguanylate cyclase [Bacillus pinisoli]